jgi:hypothetical protein
MISENSNKPSKRKVTSFSLEKNSVFLSYENSDFIMNNLSQANKKLYGRLVNIIMLFWLTGTLLLYSVFKMSPDKSINALFVNSLSQAIRSYVQLDYGTFLISSNAQAAPRIWLTEISILMVTTISVLLSGIVTLFFFMSQRAKIESFTEERLFSKNVFALIGTLAFIFVLFWFNFSEKLILGHYRVSVGPNDLAIFWFGTLMAILQLSSWGIFFYFAVLAAKIKFLISNIFEVR